MRGLQAIANLGRNLEQFREWLRLLLRGKQSIAQVVSLKKLHGNERLSLMLFNFVDGADIGMVQCRGGLGFTLKTLEGDRITGELFWQKLQRYQPTQFEILRFENHSHATAPDDIEYAVMRNLLPSKGA